MTACKKERLLVIVIVSFHADLACQEFLYAFHLNNYKPPLYAAIYNKDKSLFLLVSKGNCILLFNFRITLRIGRSQCGLLLLLFFLLCISGRSLLLFPFGRELGAFR